MKFSLVTLLMFLIAGCANQQALINDGYARGQTAKAEAVAKCAASANVEGCMLGAALVFGGGAGDSLPVAQSTLSTVLNSSLLGTIAGAGIGAVRDIKVAESQERTQIAATNANAATQGAMFNAFAGVAQSGYGAIAQTTSAGFNATTTTAQAGFNAATVGVLSLERLGSTAINASAQTAQAITRMPPSIQAGGSVTQGDGNDNSTRRDTLTAGTELRIESPSTIDMSQYSLVCTTGNAGNGGSGTVPGAAGSAGAQNQTCTLVPKAK